MRSILTLSNTQELMVSFFNQHFLSGTNSKESTSPFEFLIWDKRMVAFKYKFKYAETGKSLVVQFLLWLS